MRTCQEVSIGYGGLVLYYIGLGSAFLVKVWLIGRRSFEYDNLHYAQTPKFCLV